MLEDASHPIPKVALRCVTCEIHYAPSLIESFLFQVLLCTRYSQEGRRPTPCVSVCGCAMEHCCCCSCCRMPGGKPVGNYLEEKIFVFVWTALLIYWQVFRIYTHVSEDKSDVLTSSILFVFFLVGHVIVVETMFNVLLQMQLLHAMCLCTNHQIFEAAFIFGQNVGNAIFWYHEIVSLPKCSHSDSQTEGLAFFHGVSLCWAGQRWLSFKFATQLSEL